MITARHSKVNLVSRMMVRITIISFFVSFTFVAADASIWSRDGFPVADGFDHFSNWQIDSFPIQKFEDFSAKEFDGFSDRTFADISNPEFNLFSNEWRAGFVSDQFANESFNIFPEWTFKDFEAETFDAFGNDSFDIFAVDHFGVDHFEKDHFDWVPNQAFNWFADHRRDDFSDVPSSKVIFDGFPQEQFDEWSAQEWSAQEWLESSEADFSKQESIWRERKAQFSSGFARDVRPTYYTEYSGSEGALVGKHHRLSSDVKELVIYSNDSYVKTFVEPERVVRIIARAERGETLWVFVETPYQPGVVYAKTCFPNFDVIEKLREFNSGNQDAFKMYYARDYSDTVVDLGYADYSKLAAYKGEVIVTVRKGEDPKSLKTIQTITLVYGH